MALKIHHFDKKSFLGMPRDIIEAILIEWTMLEWFAAAIARQVCHYLKLITDSRLRLWSKLSLPESSRATANDVREWLKRAGTVPKEILVATTDICIISSALKGAKDATSLIYRIPIFKSIHQHELARLPIRMPRLRHLRIDIPSINHFMNLSGVFGIYNAPYNAHFPCLTTLHLISVDFFHFPFTDGLFPALRRLVVLAARGHILDLIRVCSGSLEDLRLTINFVYDCTPPESRICLPNLKVLILQDDFVVPKLEAPNLRLICADLVGIYSNTRSFSSVVEWATYSLSHDTYITDHLINMPRLQHLMLFRHMETLRQCFESLRDDPSICPELQSIEVVESANTHSGFKLDTGFKEFLKKCVGGRVGFTLQFVDNVVRVARHEQYFPTDVCLFIICVFTYLIMLLGKPWLIRRRNECPWNRVASLFAETVGIVISASNKALRPTASYRARLALHNPFFVEYR